MKIRTFLSKRKKEIMILSFLSAISFLLLLTFRYGNDFYWHLKAGEYMVDHHTILKTDPFSWYLKSFHPLWISHEWLFEVVLHGISVLFGKFGPLLLVFLSLISLLLILYFTNYKAFHKNIYYTLFWLCSSSVLTLNTLPRPFLFSNLLLALTFYLLYDLKEHECSKKIYFLPFFACLWANVHGGASNLSYILIFAFYFCGLFHFSFGKITSSSYTPLQKKKYLSVFFFTLVAICINPHGIKMLMYPYQNMNDAFMLATISEWQSINFNDSSSLLYLFMLSSFFLPLIISKKKIELVDFLIVLMFSFLGFKSIRFWPLSFIALTYVGFHYVSSYHRRLVIFDRSLILLSFGIIIFSICCFQMPNYDLFDPMFIHILKEEKPKRLYNYYNYGGYLISHDIPVFIDSRADLYSKYNYQDSYNLSVLRGPYEDLLKKYDFDYLILDKGSPLAYYLSKSLQYELVLDKKNTVLYRKKEGR